jgi:hypothetical protein
MPRPSDTDPVTSTEMLARVRSRRAAAIAAEADLLVLAAEWADAHPDLDHDPEDPDAERGIPGWCWSASAPFAAALGRSTASGEALIRDALVLRHRLPSVWSQVVRGGLEAWRARRIAQTVLGAYDDVCAHLDSELAAAAATVGAVTLERLLDEAMLRLHPEERELAQFTALDHRHATLHAGSINHTGVADMTLRGDWKDLHDFDQALSRVAAALGALDEQQGDFVESLDVRRARAVGVLADPGVAAALLAGREVRPTKRLTLVVHVSQEALTGSDPVGRCETLGRPVLVQQVRDWCGRPDTHVTVQPVIDLADHAQTEAYEVRDRLRTRADLLNPSCVFPWCTRPARRCDHDHGVPFEAGGATCDCNLAPLCRRHHRLKTHAGWRYTTLETGTYLWSDPHGQQFLRDLSGTRDVTPADRPVARGSGCRAGPVARCQGTVRLPRAT